MRKFVADGLHPPGPATFEDAVAGLRIGLRPAAHGTRSLRRPALPFLDEIVRGADVDDPARWQVSPEKVFAAARASTVAVAELPASAAHFGPSVLHVPDYGGDHLASWILLDGWLAALGEQVGGHPVAFAPSTLMLLICRDEPRLVEQLYELAAEEYGRTSRPLSPMAYTPDFTGRVVPFEPDLDHPAFLAAARAHRRLATDVTEYQRRTLNVPELVECTLAGRVGGAAFTAATWRVGTPAMLPAVDYVGVAVPGAPTFFVSWPVLVEADLLVEEVEFRPARYSVPAEPSGAALGYLREHATEL